MRIQLKNPTLQAVVLVWSLFLLLTATDRFGLALYGSHAAMPLTMVVGSLIAGATSEGGGAVAFPVMTLVLGIAPHNARDFALMIQSVGMSAAAYTIIKLRIPIIHQAAYWGGIGGVIGVCFGISWIGPRLDPVFLKLFFVSLWLSFGVALYWASCVIARPTDKKIQKFDTRHATALLAAGVLGGCVSGMVGSGLDIIVFSLLTLSFNIDEKVATHTSVVLMGVNAAVGALWRLLIATQPAIAAAGAIALPPVSSEVWEYWYVCIAVVVVGAPMGARLAARVSRLTVVYFLLISIVVQFLGALIIVPWQARGLGWVMIASFTGGSILFAILSSSGRSLRLENVSHRGRFTKLGRRH